MTPKLDQNNLEFLAGLQAMSLGERLALLERIAARKRHNAIDFFLPRPKQREFFKEGATKRERLFMAGNQLGKTYAGAAEVAYHLTGEYPADWEGKKYEHPVRGWCAGESSTLVRDGPQKLLCGTPGVEVDFGTGFIRKERFTDKPTLSRGVTDAYDMIQIEHRTNGAVDGTSVLIFKSYEQGRAKFQSDTLDFLWLDEEPAMDIYSECLTRMSARPNGVLFMTFTPLKGMSDVVLRYLNEKSEYRVVVNMTIDDDPSKTPEERAKIIAGYPAHERDARARGVPMLGSGRIFQYSEGAIAFDCPPLASIPLHWAKLWGTDFGIGHPFGAVLIAWDRDADVIYVIYAHRVADQLPLQHAVVMKEVAASVPVAWPKDGGDREKSTGEALAVPYKKQGLLMLPDAATWPDGSVSTEAGVLEMSERMSTGRLKVARHLVDWWEEFRLYHRKDGQIVKLKDDLLSATRIAIMMKRFAQQVPLGGKVKKREQKIADGVDFDVFG